MLGLFYLIKKKTENNNNTYMRLLKSHPILRLANSYLVDSPQPINLNYLWNFGSLLALCLVIQIITGVTLAMHYNPSVTEAFNSVEHIMRDVNNGWLIRYLHSNTASAFFFLVYLHIGRGMYYGSYRAPRTLVWTIGTIIFILMMATGFLGYLHSPKWYELDLNFPNILLFFYNIYNNYYLFSIFSLIITISFILCYLDNFNLSDNYLIKIIQIISFIIILFVCIISLYNNITYSDIICNVGDINNEIGTKINNEIGKVNINVNDEKAGRSMATQAGITGAMVGVSGEVAKGIAKSSMPPLQKAGIIVGSAAGAGLLNVGINIFSNSFTKNPSKSTITSNLNNNVPKLLDNSQDSPLQDILWVVESLDYVCLGILYILIIQLIFKLYLKDTVRLNLSKWLNDSLSNKLEFYLNKMIKLNKQMSVFWIWYGFIVITCSIIGSIYLINGVYTNINHFIGLHSSINNNIVPTAYVSIQAALFNLNIINYISLAIIISLAAIFYYKFHFNRNLNNIYYWILFIMLIIALAFSAYILDELYTNLDSYVNIHNIKEEGMIFISTISMNKYKFNILKPFCKVNYSSTLSKNNNILNSFLKENKLKPVHLYENLHLNETRKAVLENTKNLSGIYLIFNKITGDYYVGSAATNRFYARFSNHLFYFKGSKVLKNAVKKYGLSNFSFLVLELFPEIVNKENNKKLLDLEDFYLKSLLPNYNILTEAGSSFGYKHTELDRMKMKINYSTERRELIGNLNKNKKLSMETRLKMKEKALARKERSFSEQALLNMKKKSKPVILYNLDRTVFGKYSSIVEAATSINCNEKTIRRALKTEKKVLKRRFIVKYTEK
jgi:group I intron endonuclease